MANMQKRRNMQRINKIEDLRKFQIGILDKVHEFCTSHNITYFLACGTLIGAVRHKGYIPWDDDIDLYMPRSDYEKFVHTFNDSSGRFDLLEPRKTKSYVYTFAKITDTRTIMIEKWYDNYTLGVNIDIFPLDYASDNLFIRKFQFNLIKNLYRIRIDKKVRLFRDKKIFGTFKRLVCKLLPISSYGIYLFLHKIICRKNPTNTVCDMTEVGPNIHGCFPAKAIAKTINIEFEGKQYKTLAGYDDCLKNIYGDYMTLPPSEKRITHKFEAYII